MKPRIAYQVHVGETADGMAVLNVRLQATAPEGFKALKQGIQELFADTHPLGSLTDPEDRASLLKHMAEIPNTLEEIKAQELAELDMSPKALKALEDSVHPKALDLINKMPLGPAGRVKALGAIAKLPHERQLLITAMAGLRAAHDVMANRGEREANPFNTRM